ncbi:19921_t:CDS:2, partial [Gigaspora margarita]
SLRYWELLKSIMLSDKVLACYAIYLDIHIDNRMCAHLIDKDHANSFNVWVYGYQKSFGGLLCEQFIESLIWPLLSSLHGLKFKNNNEIKFEMETELNPIPKKDYKTIETNSFSLNIPNTFDIIYGFDHEFLTKHKQRRNLLKNDPKQIKIEKENREFLEKYWKVYKLITYWYGYYLNEGIGGEKNMKEASDLFKQAANKNVPVANNGNNKAQFHLGDLYLKGRVGFQVDEEKGKKYLKLAAKKGYEDAIKLINIMESNDINEDYMNYKIHENNLLLAEDNFLNIIRDLFKHAKEKEMLYNAFHHLKTLKVSKKNINIKSFIIYSMGSKLYNKRNANSSEIEYAISLIKESADLGCVYAKNLLEFLFNTKPVDYIIKKIIS